MIQIGEFEIRECEHSGLWISRTSGDSEGEGMQVWGDTLVELSVLIEDFFRRNM